MACWRLTLCAAATLSPGALSRLDHRGPLCQPLRAGRSTPGARDGDGDALERCAESFRALLDYAAPAGINVLLENHGGLSSDPDWLVGLVRAVDSPMFGTLPDFGNFPPEVDRYEAVRKMMPFAKAVSAKCYDFGPDGEETTVDFHRMLDIVAAAGYDGYVGIEYEGSRLPERDGILAAKALLERLQRDIFALLVIGGRSHQRTVQPDGEQADGNGPDIGQYGVGEPEEAGRVGEVLHGACLTGRCHLR
jgi:hypothetical protein